MKLVIQESDHGALVLQELEDVVNVSVHALGLDGVAGYQILRGTRNGSLVEEDASEHGILTEDLALQKDEPFDLVLGLDGVHCCLALLVVLEDVLLVLDRDLVGCDTDSEEFVDEGPLVLLKLIFVGGVCHSGSAEVGQRRLGPVSHGFALAPSWNLFVEASVGKASLGDDVKFASCGVAVVALAVRVPTFLHSLQRKQVEDLASLALADVLKSRN